ncbi:hypothetical protein ACNOYE_23200 [Nannocystaceae bacterium ST9]
MLLGKGPLHLLAILLVGCTKEDGSDEEFADESGTDTESGSATESTDTESSADGGTDGDGSTADEAGDDLGESDETSPGDETSGGDCELGEYISDPLGLQIDWEQASGMVTHGVTRGVFESSHRVDAVFVTGLANDDAMLCVEWLVADGDVDIDACNVYYTQGSGVGGDPDGAFVSLAVDTATFDVGDGPVALETFPGTEFNPTRYGGSFSPPPDVPFGGTATLAVSFDDLPALDLDLDVPEDMMPVGPAFGSTTLGSEELATWTWSNSGGSEPIELEIHVGATPYGSGWSEWVSIRCNVTDDGEFAFPSEYFDLARDRLGAEIYAAATIIRRSRGQVPLAGESLYWQSRNEVTLGVEIVD